MLDPSDWAAMLLRLGVATLIGLVLGLEREWHRHDAGLRTHALVSLSSAMITISSLLLFDTLRREGGHSDPLRVIQGLAQAIGFIAGGLIFIRGGGVRNMTTAASLWTAAAAGIGAGAGQYLLVGLASAMAALLLLLDRWVKRWLPAHRHTRAGDEPDRLPNRRGSTRMTASRESDR
ncbi:MgtC/SapB family protein [Sphingomonas sp. PR090111-T3T-6A]|uniref:MgtC/SapB family protein n=1 Tax=Sphingomonas sp. PR090111-T3T-6A TaxID=685778 RepID=UPI00037E17EC|nr:MgtC/SapB family protein [Sphingomonas sp. PR090111-T3T-6A]